MEKKYSTIEVLWLILIAVLITVGFISGLSTINSGVSHGGAMRDFLFTLQSLTTTMKGFVPYLSAMLWTVVCLSHIYEFYIKWKSNELSVGSLVLYSIFTIVVGVLLYWFCVTATSSSEYLS